MPVSRHAIWIYVFANTCTVHTTIRALETLNISNNHLARALKPNAWKGRGTNYNEGYREDDWGSKDKHYEIDISGVIALADGIKTNGTMVTVNVIGNNIGKGQLSKLQELMQAHPTLVSLCGIANEATEANLSGLGMDADDAAILADELPAKGALETITFGDEQAVTMKTDMAEANLGGKKLGASGAIVVAAFLPKCQ